MAKILKELHSANGHRWTGTYTKSGASGGSHTNINSLSVLSTGAISGSGIGDGEDFKVKGSISPDGTFAFQFKRKKDGFVTISHKGVLSSKETLSGAYKKAAPAEEGTFKFTIEIGDDDDLDD